MTPLRRLGALCLKAAFTVLYAHADMMPLGHGNTAAVFFISFRMIARAILKPMKIRVRARWLRHFLVGR